MRSAHPFAGIVGDVPVHVGDYVSPTTILTTLDENVDLEAYIYIPTDRATHGTYGACRWTCWRVMARSWRSLR